MKFYDTINKHLALVTEQDPGELTDAAAPDPNATPASVPGSDTSTPVAPVAPVGYVDMVRLLIKATAMNFPAGALDELYRTEVTRDNAFGIQKAITATLKQYESTGDNLERLNNPHYKQFVDSVNPKNFIEKLKKIESIIKSQDPYVK